MSTLFYVSDSFTDTPINWTSSNPTWHYPGTFNMEKAWGFGQPIVATFDAGEFSFIVFSTSGGGNNGDVYIGVYDVGTGVAIPVPDSRLKFLTSTGGAMADANLMNSVFRNDVGTALAGGRYVAHPIPLGGVTTPTSSSTYSGSFQIGPVMRFFGNLGGATALSYQYFMQGTVDPATSTSTGGGSTGASTTFTLNGLTYTVQST